MALSADQSAVLEMLLTSGQSYADLDDLFGLDEGDSRERARAALEALGGADPDRNVGLTDYLLGQADPIGRADAVRHLRQDADDRGLAEEIIRGLEEAFPGAELPKLPQSPSGSRFGGRAAAPPAASEDEKRTKESRSTLTPRQTRIYAAIGAGAIVLIAVVLAVAGVFSGEEADPAAATDDSEETAQTDPLDPSTPIPDGEEISRIPLAPPGGGDAGGAAVVGLTDSDQPYLDLVLSNVPEAPEDQAYLVWFMFDENTGYPLPAEIAPTKKTFEGRFAIPIEAAGTISRARSVELSLSKPAQVLGAVEAAAASGTFAIKRPGETILRGDVPRNPSIPEDQVAPGEEGSVP
jgi:hypothetical protein